jgi:UDP-glucose 4-epimerase
LEVEESTRLPLKYYENNFLNSLSLIKTAMAHGVKNIVFSSTCAVYGNPSQIPVKEDCGTDPVSPYGKSKLMTEWLLRDLKSSSEQALNYALLRYFNVAGAHGAGGIGQATPRATQLVKVAAEVALGVRPELSVFGTDYPTHDGTCIRDYIHVDDLAEAHVLALKRMEAGGSSEIFNLGYGKGYSVWDIVRSMKRVSGVDFRVKEAPRRAGDAVSIYADPTKSKKLLNWMPKHEDLDYICRTAFEWERHYRKL